MRFRPVPVLLSLLMLACPVGSGSAPRPAPARRIVSMSPHYTAILYDLGAEDALVGVTDYCRSPEAARTKTRVGGFLDPNLEKVVQLEPDLVLMLRAHGSRIERLKALGLNVRVMENDRLEDVYKAYEELGRLTGRRAEAQRALERLKSRLQAVHQAARGTERTVLFVVGKDPGRLSNLYAAGPGTFPDEVLRLAGFRNVLADSKIRYPTVSREALLKRDPDLVVQVPPEGVSDKRALKELDSWKAWPDLRAVRDKRVFLVPDAAMMIPGPNTADLAEWLLKIAGSK